MKTKSPVALLFFCLALTIVPAHAQGGPELLAELHSVPLRNFAENESVFQVGGRKAFSDHYIFLFAAGRGIPGSSEREPKFLGYFGLQINIGK